MELLKLEHRVQKVVFQKESRFHDGILELSKEQLADVCLAGIRGFSLDFDVAYPGESTRIIHITDTLQPVSKEGGTAFPGWTDGADLCGSGVTHCLENVCLMQSFQWPGIQEGIVDMDAEGARYSTFSKTINVVMLVTMTDPSIPKPEVAASLIRMATRGAEYLAALAKDAPGATGERFLLSEPECGEKLPRIGYVYFLQAQGPLRNVHVFGENCTKMKPRWLHPNQVVDGGIVSGNYIIACQKNPTVLHQKNPVVLEGYARHGKSLIFDGVIISVESSLLEEKRANAAAIAQIAKEHHLDGVIITQEGGGHADVDLMQAADVCEAEGIRSVILANELAGADGSLPSLAAFSRNMDAIVTTGNNDEVIHLNPVARAIGGDSIQNGKFAATGAIETSLGILYTATNQLGVSNMSMESV